ncbi:nucleoid DNA-binding protein [Streptomyces canus]
MNRSELVAALADRAEVTRKDADAVLAAFAETVGEIVAKGDEKVTIPGFLTFERTHRAARTARNPQTGDPIQIPAGYSVKVSGGLQAEGSRQGQVRAPARRPGVAPWATAAPLWLVAQFPAPLKGRFSRTPMGRSPESG